MKTKLFPLMVALFLCCSTQPEKAGAQEYDVNYESYYNEKYDYTVIYPDFLIPQGESDSRDGQAFISKDNTRKMFVYRDFKAITGDNPPIASAFEEELQTSENVTEHLLFENHYFIKGKQDKNTFYKKYTIWDGNDYFVIYFEYPVADEQLFEDINRQVTESFSVGGSDAESDGFVTFLFQFLDECFWNVNFNALLRDNDKRLLKYIDPQMDIRRYYNPGAIAHLYTRADNFGFGDFNDFDTEPEPGGEYSLKKLPPAASICDLDFNHGKGFPELYYGPASSVPDEVVNSEDFTIRPVTLPYPDAAIMVVYLPDYYEENVNPRAFYFVETPSGWKLAFVNDSLCSA